MAGAIFAMNIFSLHRIMPKPSWLASVTAAFTLSLPASSAEAAAPPVANTASLLAACGITAYDQAALKNMAVAFNDRSAALLKIGLGDARTDVCRAMEALNAAHGPKVSDAVFAQRIAAAQYLAKLAILYRLQQEKWPLPPEGVSLLVQAFEVPKKDVARWPAKARRHKLLDYCITNTREEAVLNSLDGIYPGDLRNSGFAQFAADFQERYMSGR